MPASTHAAREPLTFLSGTGQSDALLNSDAWASSSIGEPATWPQSLQSVVGLMLSSKFPMFVAWGENLTFLYNDAYAPILGTKHPSAFGRPFEAVWSEIWEDLRPLVDRALGGEATFLEDLPLTMNRKGFDEQTWFTFSYSPLRDESGAVAGMFCACTETTEKVLALRRNAAERHRLEQLFGEAPAFMALLTGPNHVFELANKAYMQLVGHREIVGKAAREALPEIQGQGFFELLDSVYASAEPFTGQQVPLMIQRARGAAPEQAFVDFVYQPIVAAAGEVTGIFVTGYEVTELRAARDRLRLAQEAGRVGTFELLPKSRTLVLSDEFCRIWGIPLTRTANLDDTLKLIHPDDIEHVLTGRAKIDEDSLGDVEYRIRRPDTAEERWIARRGEAIRNAEDDLVRFAGVVYDITDRKLAEASLAAYTRNLEILNRTGAALSSVLDLDSIVQRVTDAGVDLIGAQFGAFFYNTHDERGETLTLYTLSGADKSQFEGFGHPRATPIFKPTFDGSSNMRSDDITADPRYGLMGPHFGLPDGHLPVRSYLAVPVRSREGHVLGGLFFAHADPGMFSAAHEDLISGIASQAAIAMDNARLYRDAQTEIERRKKAEQHQRLLINELNHRVKNTLAVVQSLALQSFRGDTPSETARQDFSARLTALSAAHNLLTRQNWEQASLKDIITASLEAAAGANMERVAVEGPDVPLAPQTAVSVGMAIHELTTNAIKYGALSNGIGTIAVSWSADQRADRPTLHLEWRESGGPPVVPPHNRGFGSRMIQKGLAAELGGQVELTFPPQGVRCVIDAPLAKGLAA